MMSSTSRLIRFLTVGHRAWGLGLGLFVMLMGSGGSLSAEVFGLAPEDIWTTDGIRLSVERYDAHSDRIAGRIDSDRDVSVIMSVEGTTVVRGVSSSLEGVHLLCEVDLGEEAGTELSLLSFKTLSDLLAREVNWSQSGYPSIDLAADYSVGGLSFNGSSVHILFVRDADSETGREVYLASYAGLADFFAGRIDSKRSGFSTIDLDDSFDVVGVALEGPRMRILLDRGWTTDGRVLELVNYRSLEDFFAGRFESENGSRFVANLDVTRKVIGLDGGVALFWDGFESGDTMAWSATIGIPPPPPPNRAPIADAGTDRSWTTNSWLSLDGSQSRDPDGDPITVDWRMTVAPAGSNPQLSESMTLNPEFRTDLPGSYAIELLVTDSHGAEATDSVAVEILPAAGVWMQVQADTIGDRPLRRIVMPGTHDSATYTLNGDSPVAIDCEINQVNPICDLEVPRAFSGWAKAQGLNIAAQLEAGVRYLDLRVCWHETTAGPRLFACHGLRGPSMSSVLAQIEEFLDRTEREILILDFQKFYEVSWLHLGLLAEIRSRFGSRMLEAGPGFGVEQLKEITPNQMWQAGKRVIVIYGDELVQMECANDEARSARLEFMDAGRTIVLYDSSDGLFNDDRVEITVLRDFERRTIDSFEQSFSDDDLQVVYYPVNGLDGNVSRLWSQQTGPIGPAPLITFYEGNGATQNRVCSISFQDVVTEILNFYEGDEGRGSFTPQPLAAGQNPELWPREPLIRSEWANSNNIGGLADVVIDEVPNNASTFHVIQGQMTGALEDFFGIYDSSLRDFADRSNPIVSDWMGKAWPDDNLNIVMVDYIERSDVVEVAMAINDGSLERTVATVDLFEGNDISQDLVCRLDADVNRSIVFTATSTTDGGLGSSYCVNDEVRSMVLWDLEAGDVVRLYDHPDGRMEDDWLEIIVKQKLTDKRINTFERSFEDADIRVIYHRNNGLDGKVSRIQFSHQPIGPVIDFYEGNNGTQNLLCSVPISGNRTIDFATDSQCDNDEARSLIMYDVPAGRVIKLYDSPSGSRNDDWTEIVTKQPIKQITVGTFETSRQLELYDIIYHRNNGLDGKVSRAVINSTPSGPLAVLYEGNNGTQNIACTIDIGYDRTINFTTSSLCPNDEARSLVLYGVPAGRVLRLYDSPTGATSDDWVQIKTKQAISWATVGSFESAVNTSTFEVIPVPNNGLDGKVSRFVVDNTDVIANLPPTLTFKEGASGTQDTVCTLPATYSYTLNFKNSSACANDEARSVILTNVPAGARLRVYDDPGCGTGDDWADIRTSAHVYRFTVNSFEINFNNGVVSQTYHIDNGLNGKVSCIRFEP